MGRQHEMARMFSRLSMLHSHSRHSNCFVATSILPTTPTCITLVFAKSCDQNSDRGVPFRLVREGKFTVGMSLQIGAADRGRERGSEISHGERTLCVCRPTSDHSIHLNRPREGRREGGGRHDNRRQRQISGPLFANSLPA